MNPEIGEATSRLCISGLFPDDEIMQPDPESVNKRDREVVERIRARPLSRTWPTGAGVLPLGSRVTVIQDPAWEGPWQTEFTGTIDSLGTPEPIGHPRARDGELKYWVSFDAPQYDSSGDGPYRKAQIWDRYLRPGGELEE